MMVTAGPRQLRLLPGRLSSYPGIMGPHIFMVRCGIIVLSSLNVLKRESSKPLTSQWLAGACLATYSVGQMKTYFISSTQRIWRGRPRTTLPTVLDDDLVSSGYAFRLRSGTTPTARTSKT
ncbi:hypothetical protein GQ600_13826 [Phytophthora cactorum]|nr:hypothetical protein GQ600_19043 [Phytophthora cactorum]KAF1777404.1 hypothetical protein GQ600_13826 [Phytophthora cactorum]